MFIKRKFAISILSVSVCFMSACATGPLVVENNLPMLEVSKNHINSTRVYVGEDPANNHNMFVHQLGNSGQQYGLLGAIFETIMANQMEGSRQEREKLQAPIRSAFFKYKFGSKVREECGNQLKTIDWLKVTDVTKEPDIQRNQLPYLKTNTDEDLILTIDSIYKMNDAFTILTITLQVGLYPKAGLLEQMARSRDSNQHAALYRNTFYFDFPYDSDYFGNTTTLDGWIISDGSMLHQAMDLGIKELSRLVALDLQGNLRVGEITINNRLGRTVTAGGITGTLLEEKNNLVIVRRDNGSVHVTRRPSRALPSYQGKLDQ